MNHEAILALIADLYTMIAQRDQEIARLSEQLNKEQEDVQR